MLTELGEGQIPQEAVRLVARTAAAVARTRRYASPSGSRVWCQDDIDDLVGDFFAKSGRIFDLAASAGTGPDAEAVFAGKVELSVKRVAIDRFRRGPRGVLDRRVARRVKARPDIEPVNPKHWGLVPWHTNPHWGGADDDLVAAANSVEVVEQTWDESSGRSAPSGTTATVDAVCTAVLARAQAPVLQPVVRTIVCDRIVGQDLGNVADGAKTPERATTPEPDWADLEAAELAATEILTGLTSDEITLLPLLHESSRTLEELGVLALGKSAIAERQRKLKSVLEPILAATPDADLVAAALLTAASAVETGHQGGVAP